MPRVSVLMSVYNSQRFVAEAIESILNQSFEDYEFIIVNDGSTDSSGDIINRYHDSRIKLLVNPVNIGLTPSLNKGLRIAQGEYIARMDADDISDCQRLKYQVEFLEARKEIGLVGTSRIVIDEKGEEIKKHQAITDPQAIKKSLWQDNQFCHGSCMLRKECLEKVGLYRRPFKYSQDYDLWFRISEAYMVTNIGDYLYKLRINLKAITALLRFEQEQYAWLVRKLAAERSRYGKDNLSYYESKGLVSVMRGLFPDTAFNRKKVFADFHYRTADIMYCCGKYSQAFTWFWRAFATGIIHIGDIFLGLKIVIGMCLGKRFTSALKNIVRSLSLKLC